MPHDLNSLPIDATSAERLAAGGLRMGLVDTADRVAYDAWLQATTLGFHGGQLTDELLTAIGDSIGARRTTGVWDDTAAEPITPVGTVDAFVSPLTLPGGGELPAWAVSMVTVAQSHRRRGIARELLESELRAAVALGLPMAMLTVSESTIYHRFGFAPAAMASTISIDTKRARYVGSVPDGRVHQVGIESARELVDDLAETARLASPGEIAVWPRRWSQIFGIADEKDVSKRPRAARYDDADGTPRGLVVYRMKENGHDFTGHTAQVEYLLATTPDAYAALWRFLLELDLTATVTAELRSVDEPVRWLISDFRAMKVDTYDHLWLRILDVPVALNARPWAAPIDLVIEVTDAEGHAAGRYRIAAEVERVDSAPDLTLDVTDLSAIYLGGVSASTLHGASRVTEHTAGAVAQLDAAFHSPVTPWLSVWF